MPPVTARMSRRRALTLLTAGPVAAFTWTPAEAGQAHEHAAQARAATPTAPYKRRFFTAHEYATVGVLVDLIIPRDGRSGSATDAGVPEFMDFMMVDQPRRQVAMRGGLALIDKLSQDRFGRRFVSGTDPERRSLLDEIAYTSNADPGLAHAIAFFSSFRDLTATGFFTSRMGVADLQYRGNVIVDEWTGCPEAALKKLGVTY
jgi:gluconate 2-dehydrogenase subunit 3-like protein